MVKLEDNPDVAYINTCTVTKKAGHKSRKLFRKAKKYAREVKVLGCHAKLFPEEFEDSEYINEIELYEEFPMPFQDRHRAYLPVQMGCNNFCSYCIVPYARRKSVSLPPDSVFEYLEKIIGEGYREVIITGIHIGNYNYRGIRIIQLLSDILNYNIRVRLTSLHPDKVNGDFLSLFDNENLMPYLHLSQQSGSNKILKRMNRSYGKEKTMWISKEIEKSYENIRIGGDFIAGFPGEGEDEFIETVDLIERANFSHLHVFRYSSRNRTLASLYPHKVDERVKNLRSKKLIELGKRQRRKYVKKVTGKSYRVIVQPPDSIKESFNYGITPDYLKVYFKKDGLKEKLAEVEVREMKGDLIYGEVIR